MVRKSRRKGNLPAFFPCSLEIYVFLIRKKHMLLKTLNFLLLCFFFQQPEADEMKGIAAEGIITCLQDAIDSLKQSNVSFLLVYGNLIFFTSWVISMKKNLLRIYFNTQ